MTDTLTTVQDTWFTLSQSQSTDLPDDQKRLVSAGDKFPLSSYEPDSDWMRVTLDRDRLSSNRFGENLTWYVKAADVIIDKDSLGVPGITPRTRDPASAPDIAPDTDTPP